MESEQRQLIRKLVELAHGDLTLAIAALDNGRTYERAARFIRNHFDTLTPRTKRATLTLHSEEEE